MSDTMEASADTGIVEEAVSTPPAAAPEQEPGQTAGSGAASPALSDDHHDWTTSFTGIDTRAASPGGAPGAAASSDDSGGGFFSGIADAVSDVASGVVSTVGNVASDVGHTVTDVASGVVNTVETTVSDIGHTVSDAAGGVVNTVSTVAGDVASGHFGDALTDAEKGVVTTTGQVLDDAAHTVVDAGSGLLNTAGKLITDTNQIVTDAATGVISTAGKATNDIAQGVAQAAGPDSMIGKAAGAFGNAATTVTGGVVDGINTANDFNKGVVEGVVGGVEGMATGLVSLGEGIAKEGYALATDEKAREQAGKTVLHGLEAVGQFETTLVTDPSKALGQVEDAAKGAVNTVETLAGNAYKGYQAAAAQGHGAEFIGKGVGQVGVLVAGAVLTDGASLAGEGAAVAGETAMVATEGAEVLSGGANLVRGAEVLEDAATVAKGANAVEEGAGALSQSAGVARGASEAEEGAAVLEQGAAATKGTAQATTGDAALDSEIDAAVDNARADGPYARMPAQDPADASRGLQDIVERTKDNPAKIQHQVKFEINDVDGAPEGRGVEARWHTENPNAPEGTYSHDNPTMQVNTEPELKASGKIKKGSELYKLPDGSWKKISDMSEAEKAAAHYGAGEELVLQTAPRAASAAGETGELAEAGVEAETELGAAEAGGGTPAEGGGGAGGGGDPPSSGAPPDEPPSGGSGGGGSDGGGSGGRPTPKAPEQWLKWPPPEEPPLAELPAERVPDVWPEVSPELPSEAAANWEDASGPARNLLEKATEQEPKLTEAVNGATDEAGGKMIGLKHRVKGAKSLTEKIAKDMAKKNITSERAAAQMSDAVRYTSSFPPDKLADGAMSTIEKLKAEGNEVMEIKNTWTDPDVSYKGVNVKMIGPDGQPFELQFHTPESFWAKDEGTHEIFEKMRNLEPGSPEWMELNEQQMEISRSLEVPKGIDKIKPFKKGP